MIVSGVVALISRLIFLFFYNPTPDQRKVSSGQKTQKANESIGI
jgi:hypothetical protein